jgi:hypothetical protein
MARFIGSVHGNRGPASRLGTDRSGIDSHTNGRNAGVRVAARVENNEDVFYVYQTGGSNNRNLDVHIATIRNGHVTHWNVTPEELI